MKYSDFKHKIQSLPVFSASMLGALTTEPNMLRVQLSGWKKKGLVQSLKKGLYVLSPEERKIEPSHLYLANQMFIPSYVSLESALSYYDMIPEAVYTTTSVTTRKTCRFTNEFGVFKYQHIASEAYGGFERIQEPGGLPILMAAPEKAIVDFIYLNLSRFDAKDGLIFSESYRFQNYENLSKVSLRKFADRFGSKKLSSVIELFIAVCVSQKTGKKIQ